MPCVWCGTVGGPAGAESAAPKPPPQPVPGPPGASVLASIDAQARVDPNRSETAFVVGPNYYFKRDHGEFRYLVSLSVTTYQGLMYRVRHLPVPPPAPC